VDTTELRKAYADFLAVAEAGGFGPPPPGEWDAERLLAHIYSGHNQIAAVALRVIAGERPSYDNRPSLDEWNLRRIVEQAGDLAGLIELVRRQGELYCAVVEQVPDALGGVLVPVLIISNDELIVDEPWPLAQLVQGVAAVHLPRHADQLRSLVAVNA
jgi:hypothetical protein